MLAVRQYVRCLEDLKSGIKAHGIDMIDWLAASAASRDLFRMAEMSQPDRNETMKLAAEFRSIAESFERQGQQPRCSSDGLSVGA